MRNGISIQSDPVSGPVEPPAPPATYAGGNPDAAPSAAVVPAWVAFDRKVLRYYLFFKESVNESRIENYRIRALTLFYYLEDDSMHISEPKVENSGMVQGERKGAVFLKRHRAPKQDGGFFGPADFKVGETIEIHYCVYKLTGADAFTRAFHDKIGVPLAPAIETPTDPYTIGREEMKEQIIRNQKYFHPRKSDDDLIRGMEARLGLSAAQLEPDKLDQFLKCAAARRCRRPLFPFSLPPPPTSRPPLPLDAHRPPPPSFPPRYDRKVLRFYLAWDDRKSLYGELRPFVLHYYLADDELEILEVRRANAGRDPFPLFLKKGKCFKNIESYLHIDAPTTHTTQLIDRTGRVAPETMETFTEADFSVGKEVTINGATFLVYGCDEFTRDYYTKVYGVTFEDIPVQFDENVERPQVVIPPHVAPGSEEDSLGSFLYLIPKVPKKNFRRMMENDRKILRYMARLDTTAPEDRDRIFVIKYYLADDTVGVFEPPRKNSGIIGGKFLERTRIKKPQSHEYYSQSDFYTGATIEVTMFRFIIYQADEYTLSYMESDPESHPMSDMGYIAAQLGPEIAAKKEALAAEFAKYDGAGEGKVSYEVLQEVLASFGLELNDQALITLMRRFDLEKEGKVSYMEILSMA